MATHDYVIANGTGSAVRSDLNNALAAIVSNNSSSSEPATKYAYQWWADTTTGQLKLRNSANNAWVTIFELDGTMLMEDGTVSAPGLAFASDLNTGFFRSAADKINFATGGVERLEIGSSEVVFNDGSNDVDFRVESNGQTHMLFVDGGNDRVGIGESSPDQTFHVKTTSDDVAKLESTSNGNGPNLTFAHTGSSPADDDIIGKLTFTATNDASQQTTFGDIRAVSSDVSDGSEDGAFTFNTRADGSFAERLRISSNGNTGIGTSSPQSSLSVAGSIPNAPSTEGVHLGLTSNYAKMQLSGNTGGIIDFAEAGVDNAGRILYTHSTDAMQFSTAASTKMTIDSSGRVLLGTTTEGVADGDNLTIADSGPCGITLRSGSSSGGAIYFSDATSGAGEYAGFVEYLHSSDALRFASGGTERMRIDSSGNVELGRAGTSLHFQNGFNNSTSRIQNGGGSNSSNFKFLVTNSGSESEAMSIRSSGALHVFNSDVGIRSISGAAAGTSVTIFRGSHSGTGIVSVGTESIYIFSNGNVQNSNNSYGQISDVKLKENIVDANSQWNDIKGVQVRNFNFKEETGNPTHTQIGVVAQELETVSPGLVYETPDTDDDGNDLGTVTKSVNYSVLYMKAVKALQEAMTRIETLEQRLTDAGIA